MKGVEVRRVETLPPARAPEIEELGRRVSLTEAARLAGFRPRVPADLGPPDEVRFDAAARFVTLVYDPGAKDPLIVAQGAATLDERLVRKVLPAGSRIREIDVDGEPGVFLSGARHGYLLLLLRPDGTTTEDRTRLAANTLIFNRDELVVRIESRGLRLDRALAIARSLR
ncbi:MAG TPA: hypothetical protein VGW10_08400 [Solirubrobacteraceae bacterium]|nr:hypothetical protein [Solirubrobacteraceae bacterium]